VIGYNIYRGTTSGGQYPLKLNSSPQPGTSFSDNTVRSGTTYYYVATSLDANSVESSYSNQLTMVIP
jgi:fibronectin type 3 domain-containing protein